MINNTIDRKIRRYIVINPFMNRTLLEIGNVTQ